MKLYGLLIAALFISINVFSIGSDDERQVVSKDEYISLFDKYKQANKETIWENDFTDVSNWEAQNFLLLNTDELEVVTIGNEKISFLDKIRYPNISNKCIVSTDFDSNENLNSKLTLNEPISISGYSDIELRFSQVYRPIKDSHTYIMFSTDNGEMWTKLEVNRKIKNNLEAINDVVVNISWLTKDKDNLLIKFESSSNDLSWIVDNVMLQGLTTLLPEITTLTPDQGSQGESLSVGLSGQFTHFFQGSETVWFEQGSQTIFSGSNILVSSFTEMNLNVDIPFSAPTGLYDVKVENPTDGIITKVDGFEVTPAPSPGWTFTSTGLSHDILIPSFASLTIDGLPISQGDYIGAFYDSLGTPACAGFVLWSNSSVILSAMGDDPFTTEKDGFSVAEEFMWKIWDASSSSEYSANASYQLSGFPNSNLFALNGNSGISSLESFSYQTQTIALNQGWDIYSTYINPVDPTMEAVFAPVISNLLIVKNGNGQVYWPPYVNLIGSFAIGEGYQINMSAQSSLDVTGTAIVPELTPISIPNGWSILGYLRSSPANAVTLLSSIVNNVIIVKDGWGEVYWPAWGINNIGNFDPGGGYQIRLDNAVTLTYPANTQVSKSGEYVSSYNQTHYSVPENTGSNMTLGIPISSWQTLPVPGDEVGVFNADGEIIGSSVFENENMAITIFGDDEFTKDKTELIAESIEFELRLYSISSGIERKMMINSWIEGSSLYKKDGISVVGNMSLQRDILGLSNSPNPCTSSTTISFELESNSNARINIYNSMGEIVLNVIDKQLSAGIHNFEVNISNLKSGTYFYKLSTDNNNESKQFLIVK